MRTRCRQEGAGRGFKVPGQSTDRGPVAIDRRAMVTADVLVVLTLICFILVVLGFGWWRSRRAEPAPVKAPPAKTPSVPESFASGVAWPGAADRG